MRVLFRRLSTLALAASALLSLGATLSPAQAQGALDLTPCRVDGLGREARCGWLSRPLGGTTGGSKDAEIRIRVVVLPAMARIGKPDPVFFLAGGPGQSAIELAPLLQQRFSRLRNRRDLVLVDQRGTGQSAPLQCPMVPPTRPLSASADPRVQAEEIQACMREAQALPYGDLTAFTTTHAMQDLDAVRAALGADQINLIGGSYGTRAGLEYLRLYPERVRRLVLDGLAPPDMALPVSMGLDARALLLQQLDRCESDDRCRQYFPRLRAQWEQLVRQPRIEVQGRHPLTGVPERFSMPSQSMWELGRISLYAPEVASLLPHAISQAASGNWAPFLGMLSLMNTHPRRPMAGAMHFSVVCSEDLPVMEGKVSGTTPPRVPPEAEPAVRASSEAYRAACQSWPRARIDPGFYQIQAAKSPVLLLSGGADPVTPPTHGERVARLLGSRARHAIVPNAGHGVMGLNCMRDAIYAFVNAQTDEVAQATPIDCASSLPSPLTFVPVGARP